LWIKVGAKGKHAVMAVVDVARNSGSNSVPLFEVANRLGISLSYLENCFALLRRSGLVASIRGPGGGYRLGKPARQQGF
jgi:Rrf2 family iron-sulfur cluster assembly transcriptional regulator